VSDLTLADLTTCFGGAIPAVVVTADASGNPNVTYVSRAHAVDTERIALSNQFFSKTARNLVDNPRVSLLLVDPTSHDEYRLSLRFERTERRGQVFERLRDDVDALALLSGMQDVFRLRGADIYRVLHIEHVQASRPGVSRAHRPATPRAVDMAGLAELCERLARCADLDVLVSTTVAGLARLGYEHVQLLLLDEDGRRLYTIGSHGYAYEGVGAEVVVGEGLVGMAAAQCRPVRMGNLRQMAKYSRSVRRSVEAEAAEPVRDVALPELPGVESRVVVPAMALGQLVGVLVAERSEPVAFDASDEALLSVIAAIVASAVEAARAAEREDVRDAVPAAVAVSPGQSGNARSTVRFYASDASTFLDGEYLIKGVAGRILWSLLRQHEAAGRTNFTNRELRMDPSLELPGFKDNFESRLILLKRRLDERQAPVRIHKTGRGRFRLDVATAIRLEAADE
jgi:adenylate cyclase